MLTTFLETGNGSVVVNGLQPQPIGNTLPSTLATIQTLMQLILPRDANGNILSGAYSGEYMIQAFDTTTGDIFFQLETIVITSFNGTTVIKAVASLALSRTGTLAGMTQTAAVAASGDINFNVTPGTANATNVSGIGIFLPQ